MRNGFSYNKLRALKANRKLSYRDLEKMTGIPPATMHRYCTGQTCPSVTKARILENALEIEKGGLFS